MSLVNLRGGIALISCCEFPALFSKWVLHHIAK